VAHPKRIELLELLSQGERSVESLASVTAMGTPTRRPSCRWAGATDARPARSDVRAVAAAPLAALASGEELRSGQDEETGGRIEVAGLTGLDRRPVGGQEIRSAWVIRCQPIGVGLVEAAARRHPRSVAHALARHAIRAAHPPGRC